MPFRPEHSLLRVEVPGLRSIDTTSVENLFGMWSLFSKASHAMEDGKRLENLSWRLWNRETFCCAPDRQRRTASACDIPMPALSSSLDSTAVNDLAASGVSIPKARPELRRHDSGETTRAKHITPIALEKMVITIKETGLREPIELPAPTAASAVLSAAVASSPSTVMSDRFGSLPRDSTESAPTPRSRETSDAHASRASLLESSASTLYTNDSRASETSHAPGSEESSCTEMSTHSIIRGFVPGGMPSSYRSQTHLHTQPAPILKTSPSYHQIQPKKKAAMFTIGTSSDDDNDSSLESRFKSTLSESLKRPNSLHSSLNKKQTSFQEDVGKAVQHSPVFESDDEDEEVSESAIEDDDDSSDWEDSDNQSGSSSMNERDLFQRVDSRPNLTSRRSLLTTLMHEPDRAKALANAASRSTPALRRSRNSTPNGPSLAASPETSGPAHVPGLGTAQSRPIIMTTSNTHPQQTLALSPRTTRRNMLSTELTESLRKNLLWERQHKSNGNLAALKRRHTSNDVKNLKQHPDPAPVFSHRNRSNFTNDYFNAGLGQYHEKGW